MFSIVFCEWTFNCLCWPTSQGDRWLSPRNYSPCCCCWHHRGGGQPPLKVALWLFCHHSFPWQWVVCFESLLLKEIFITQSLFWWISTKLRKQSLSLNKSTKKVQPVFLFVVISVLAVISGGTYKFCITTHGSEQVKSSCEFYMEQAFNIPR